MAIVPMRFFILLVFIASDQFKRLRSVWLVETFGPSAGCVRDTLQMDFLTFDQHFCTTHLSWRRTLTQPQQFAPNRLVNHWKYWTFSLKTVNFTQKSRFSTALPSEREIDYFPL